MKYSWDDEVISPKYNSTQENIFLAHLAGKSPDLIVLNSGLHDAGRIPLPAYAENLHSLGRMIRPFTHKGSVVVWLGTNDVRSDLIPAQYCNLALRETILTLNEVAGKVTRVYGMIYLDAFPLSNASFGLHSDGAHLHHQGDMYYRLLAMRTLLPAICPLLPHVRPPSGLALDPQPLYWAPWNEFVWEGVSFC